jgi:hypothetical protein
MVTSSESLANPKSKFQSTSTQEVKYKKIKDDKYVENVEDAIKIIKKHLIKINKNKN